MEFLEKITPREYQQKIFEKCVEKNCLVVLPTGLGKTLIALMLTIERMKKFPGEKVLFLAPTKPLVEQHLDYFKKHLPELFAEMNLFTGQINAEARKKLWQNTDIIFSTPQCIANDLKNRLYDLKNVCLLIEDEAHRCIKNYDYNFVAQKYKEHSVHQRIIGMTASPGYDKTKINEICKNLSIEEVELKTRDSDDVKPYLQELEFDKRVIDFPDELDSLRESLKKLFNSYITDIKMRGVFWGNSSKIGLIELQKKLMSAVSHGNRNYNYLLAVSSCSIAIKLQHALELLETQTLASFTEYLKELFKQAVDKKSKGIVKLVSNPEFSSIYIKSNELLAKGFEHPKIEELIKIIEIEKSRNEKLKVIVFMQFRDTASVISKKLNMIPGICSKVFVGQAKKISSKGESTGLNQKEQKKIIQEFSSGEINILCATSIAEEGLDIPEVNIVIFYESVPSAIRKIQRGGRTARLMAGKLIMLITKSTRDESFYYVANAREKKMHKTIQDIKEDMLNKDKSEVQKRLL
ncbi:MAG: DEAD/DEAH box helicase family protein [Candidatus Nanoarchaeia archaeon]|nr:DEAD/DEAH box helicase family protein [Candidatus Nanoarchaeia archaeon]MDD5358516.1 DEAD/DEAH box helicase family protein [Candidatus Nanoarchaeia archaeon]MDD5589030.1 DEAD/DEAH box helicase family protein [Candidatus Nanoarchaeia archaeon]